MNYFILSVFAITLLSWTIYFFIKRDLVWKYKGVVFIFLSFLYFVLIFYIAKYLKDWF